MKRLIYFLLPVVLLGAWIGWRAHSNSVQRATQAKLVQARKTAAPVVRVAPAVVRDIVHVFQGVGSVDSPFNVHIAPQVTGRLEYLQVREGDHVTRGEVLARIDPSEIQATVRQQQAAVAEAQQRLTQAQLTANPNSVAVATQIRQQKATVDSAQANVNQAEQNYAAQVAAAQANVTDAQGKVDSANSTIRNAKAGLTGAQANLKDAQVKYDRYNMLLKSGFAALQDVDDAEAQVGVQKSAVGIAEAQVAGAQDSLKSAQAELEAAQHQATIVANTGKATITSAQAALREANAALEYARANKAQRPAYQANLAALKATVDVAQGQLKNAQAQLANTILHSPIDGYVTGRFVDPGSIATAGQAIIDVESLRQVFVTTSAPQEYSSVIRLGQTATVTIDALQGRIFTGKVTQVNPASDPTSRQFVIRTTLDNPQGLVRPGMFTNVTVVTKLTPHAVVVPLEALQQGKNGPSVAVVDSSMKVHRRPVQTGDQDSSGIAITQGVQAGETVVVLSAQPVKDGQIVQIDTGAEPEPTEGSAPGQPAVAGGGGGAPFSKGASTVGGASAPTYSSASSVGGPAAATPAFMPANAGGTNSGAANANGSTPGSAASTPAGQTAAPTISGPGGIPVPPGGTQPTPGPGQATGAQPIISNGRSSAPASSFTGSAPAASPGSVPAGSGGVPGASSVPRTAPATGAGTGASSGAPGASGAGGR